MAITLLSGLSGYLTYRLRRIERQEAERAAEREESRRAHAWVNNEAKKKLQKIDEKIEVLFRDHTRLMEKIEELREHGPRGVYQQLQEIKLQLATFLRNKD